MAAVALCLAVNAVSATPGAMENNAGWGERKYRQGVLKIQAKGSCSSNHMQTCQGALGSQLGSVPAAAARAAPTKPFKNER